MSGRKPIYPITPDRSWTLFLDRDGVINVEKPNGYILSWTEFAFIEGAVEAIRQLSQRFGRLLIVTNQRGVGKGLMSLEDLETIHKNMLSIIRSAGGHIDKIYACTDLDPESPYRKPQTGMAARAKRDFPTIDFARSVMVGNNISDMQFGRALGMHTVWIASTHPDPGPEWADESHDSLWTWALSLEESL